MNLVPRLGGRMTLALVLSLPVIWGGTAVMPALPTTCPDVNYVLTTQDEVDDFPTGCSAISGDLRIIDSADISDLSPLSNIFSVGGALELRGNQALVYTNVMENLHSVGGEIRISNNPYLENIRILWNVTAVHDLFLEDNPRLDKVDGMYHVLQAGGDLVIARNSKLLHLYGLWNLESVGGSLRVQENQSMINLDALWHVGFVGGSLEVQGNTHLASCGPGLYSLVKGGHVTRGATMNGNAAGGDCNNNGANLVPASDIHNSRPVPTSPPNGGTAEIVPYIELLWKRLAGADRYDVQIASNSSFSIASIVGLDNVPNVRSKFHDAVVGQRYYWRVRAVGSGVTTGWSDVWNTTAALAKPEASVLIAPTGAAAGISVDPVFKWIDPDSTFLYQFQVASDAGFAHLVADRTGLTKGSASLGNPLAEGATYYWRVRARNASGEGPWSTVASFQTAVAVPDVVTLELPLDGMTDVAVNPVFTWLESESATHYQLEVASDSDFAELVVNDSALTEAFDSLEAPLARETGYFWRVRGQNEGGDGPWSEVRSFVTELGIPEPVTLAAPENGATGVPPYLTLEWLPVEDIIGYDLQIARDPAFSTPAVDDTLLQESAITLSAPLAYHTAYYWHVRAERDDGSGKSDSILYGPWSETHSFTVAVGTATEDGLSIPAEFALHQNYPNPFNPDRVGTTIRFDVPEATTVRLVVFDALGRVVESIVDGQWSAGSHHVTWRPEGLPSGEYFIRMNADTFSATSRVLLSK